MKKVLLSGILALAAAASFAQNSATTTQVGTANSSTAIQGGSSLTATISQVGSTATDVTNNMATTNQTGTGHTATINQNDGSTFNRAYATQIGTGPGSNSATISQSNGSGGVAARGGDRIIVEGNLGNWAGTFQVGSNNEATVTQDGLGSGADPENPFPKGEDEQFIIIFGGNSETNLGEITQRGTSNTATTTQSNGAVSNLSQIFQGYNLADVTGNMATVNQDAGRRNEALVNQFSNTNTATVLQNTATSTDNKAFVTQGNGLDVMGQASNTAIVEQLGTSISNTATVTQTGSQGSATVRQRDGSNNNVAFIEQVVGRSSATINQTGYGGGALRNKASIVQYGDFHIGLITQNAARDNVASIQQGAAGTATSNNGRAYINQVSGVTNSTATINQNLTVMGARNKAQIDQTGAFTLQQASISQEGSDNVAGLIQTGGSSNTATVSQTGNFNTVSGPGMTDEFNSLPSNSYALQNGSGNTMTVTQTSTGAPTTALLNNMATLSQIGMGNTINLTQTLNGAATAGNMSTINQNGNMNAATVMQSNGMTP